MTLLASAPPTFYEQERFDANLPKWADTIRSGRKTAADLIQFIETRGEPLTEEQKARLLSVKATPPEAQPDVQDVQPKQASTQKPPSGPTYADLAGRISGATSLADLDGMDELIGQVANEQHRAELVELLDKAVSDMPF